MVGCLELKRRLSELMHWKLYLDQVHGLFREDGKTLVGNLASFYGIIASVLFDAQKNDSGYFKRCACDQIQAQYAGKLVNIVQSHTLLCS